MTTKPGNTHEKNEQAHHANWTGKPSVTVLVTGWGE